MPVFTATTPWAPCGAEAKKRSGGEFRRKKEAFARRASVREYAHLLAVDRARIGANAQVLDAAHDHAAREGGGRVGEQLGNRRTLARLERQVVGDPDRAVEAENGGAVDVARLDQVVINVGLPRHDARVKSLLHARAADQIVREKLIFFLFLFTGENSFACCVATRSRRGRSPATQHSAPHGSCRAPRFGAAARRIAPQQKQKKSKKIFAKKKKKKRLTVCGKCKS